MKFSSFPSLCSLFATVGVAALLSLAGQEDSRAQAAGGSAAPPKISMIITGARIIDGTGNPPIEDGLIAFSGERIVAVGPTATTQPPGKASGFVAAQAIDAHGMTIIPGLISAHSHLGLIRGATGVDAGNYTRENVSKQLDQYEGYGVTAVLSLGVNQDILYSWRDEQRLGRFPGADIFTADRGLGVPGGAPPFPLQDNQVYRPASTEEARADVREMIGRHPDLLKLWLDDLFGTAPEMAPEVYQAALAEAHAAIDEAHVRGYRFAAHVFYLQDAKDLLERGLDVVAHSVRDDAVDARFIELIKTRNAIYIPTLALDESQFVYAQHPDWMKERFFTAAVDPALLAAWNAPEYAARMKINRNTAKNRTAFEYAVKNVKALSDAGVTIAMGTDSGAMPTRIAGFGEHRELQLMVQAGLTPMQAIVAATRNSARVLGAQEDRGTLEVGKRADFLILTGNPLEDIHNTTKISAIWHGGKPVAPFVRFDDGLPKAAPGAEVDPLQIATPPPPAPSPTPRPKKGGRKQ